MRYYYIVTVHFLLGGLCSSGRITRETRSHIQPDQVPLLGFMNNRDYFSGSNHQPEISFIFYETYERDLIRLLKISLTVLKITNKILLVVQSLVFFENSQFFACYLSQKLISKQPTFFQNNKLQMTRRKLQAAIFHKRHR